MNDISQQENKKFAPTSPSRYEAVANLYLSKSKQTITIKDLEGHLLGIALRDEILALLAGKLNHVNVVLYRSVQP